jgi:hypothetical protein
MNVEKGANSADKIVPSDPLLREIAVSARESLAGHLEAIIIAIGP